MTDFFDRLHALAREHDVLKHPFYVRWSAGELTREELAEYAGQYRHAVVALADATARAGDEGHAAEERAHIELWDEFTRAVGGNTAATATAATADCADAWADPRRDRAATLAVLYAIESAQPAISETKRAGLIEHYGATPGDAATRYFDVHAVLDHEHAADDRRELETLLTADNEDRLLGEAQRALRGNWRLLDGVLAAA